MIRLALAQIASSVGDLSGNTRLILSVTDEALQAGADLIAFPELALPGYPPEDLLLRKDFLADQLRALDEIASRVDRMAVIVGFVEVDAGSLYNAAAVIQGRKVQGIYRKHHLPNYGVFDEKRYFQEGAGLLLGSIGGETFGVTICEDLWESDGPHRACVDAGASLVVNINASPYHMGKGTERQNLLASRAREHGVTFAYVNTVGGQDELVFDGQSCVVDAEGRTVTRAMQFEQELLVVDLDLGSTRSQANGAAGGGEALTIINLAPSSSEFKPVMDVRIASELAPEAEAYAALVLGVRDYLRKNGFSEAIVGLSGGIDSALTAAIAVDALGAVNVLGVSNPSEYTSARSRGLAEELSSRLGIRLLTIPIDVPFEVLKQSLKDAFAGTEEDVTEENMQARLRGLIWMAISNKTGRIVLSTGNKSEMAVGYATLYGDMAGGLAVLKDIPKSLVYRLARWRNTLKEVIPEAIIDRPPTAELRHDQLDTDSLPPYEVLDPILESYVEDDRSIDEIVAMGFDRGEVARIAKMVDMAEYKRRQAPPGIKITDRAFGRDRRLPISNRYRPWSETP